MTGSVCIIGCGQIGRRHIQGLGKSAREIRVYVSDNSPKSLENCYDFCEAIKHDISNLEIEFFNASKLKDITLASFDLTIVATTAASRYETLKQCMQNFASKAWIIEKPICQSSAELWQLQKLLENQLCFVNHYRRYISLYEKMRDSLIIGEKLNITVSVPNTGLACNASHYVDLVNFLTGEYPVTVNTDALDSFWHDGKRANFKEVNGELQVLFSQGSSLDINSNKFIEEFKILIETKDSKRKLVIDEVNAKYYVQDGRLMDFEKLYQSELTGKYYDDIISTGECKLTTFENAAKCFMPLAVKLEEHWKLYKPAGFSLTAQYT